MATVTVKKLAINGVWVRCPGRGAGDVPRKLTLMPGEQGQVMATCGEKHGRPRSGCMFPVGIHRSVLNGLADERPGAIRVTTPGGNTIEGTILPPSKKAKAAATSTGKAAAAVKGKNGAAPAPGPAKPAGRATGGAFAAACGALAAIAGAAGQVATAGASAVGSAADLGKEGIGLARDGVKEAGAYGERRHERKMRDNDAGTDTWL
ncbi:hypothetical protein G5C51_04365 [Streptomyces sp. A7024]|uniref:Uncharacterized protein n=1 Tax=Streptomyces coryli TaxID=1128680 RepID=A0A6G4TVW5_9ACTN|nr:hypothetical protein [Streptomyces coryli]NGN63141.1 hypothetical protein [Streptomyces coryli]